MKKYFKIFKISLISYLEYRVNFVLSFLFSLVPFAVSVLLWVAVAKQNEFIKVKGVVSYYFVVLIVSNITTTNSIIRFSDDIRLGELNKYLLKPYNYCFYNLMADLPQRIVFIVMNFIPLLLIYLFLHSYISLDLSLIKIFFFIIFLILGYLINFFIDFLIGLYSFYFSKVSSLYTSIKVLRNLSAGNIFPLLMLPTKIFFTLQILPFMYTSYIPTMLLLEKTSFDMILKNLFISVAWLSILCLFSAILWKRGMKKYSAYGG
ncbi:ABC transporter permease [Fusobacterium canifelinum]|uniref:ABC-2 family transporter protein n=1 Tax=Fusobacterium canifelinum TaxID=285729 RepID=A0A7T9LDW5_9FUSO|nr:ABC-2 family transporter protein [Fusobacterium canifelinum]QQB73331.1 ABC-2 family transporter protein [Fusobacterium canifelinum]QQS86854.1 ABC-2 family transporter protein [Fusobacterium canifelinum]